MSNIIKINAIPTKMDTKEIASVAGKEHKHVLRETRVMLVTLFGGNYVDRTIPADKASQRGQYIRDSVDALFKAIFEDGPDLHHQKNQGFTLHWDGRGYLSVVELNRNLTLTLVSGYDIHLRNRIISRLEELEKEAALPKPASSKPARASVRYREAAAITGAQLKICKLLGVDMAGDHWPEFQEHADFCFRQLARIAPRTKTEALAVFEYMEEHDATDRAEGPEIIRNLIAGGVGMSATAARAWFRAEPSHAEANAKSGLELAHFSCIFKGSEFGKNQFAPGIQRRPLFFYGVVFSQRNSCCIRAVRCIPGTEIVMVTGVQQLQFALYVVELKSQLCPPHLIQHLRILILLIRLKGPLDTLHQFRVIAAPALLSRLMYSGMQLRRQPERGLDEILLVDAGSHASIIVPSAMSTIATIMEACHYHDSMPL